MTKYFIVSVPVKPYVKKHITNIYGNPANFVAHSEEYKLVQKCLSDPSTKYDIRLESQMVIYSEKVDILISQDIFYRYGWEFTRTDIRTFGKFFEHEIKKKMIGCISIQIGIGRSIKDSILTYQEIFKISELDWSYESIKKDYYRNKPNITFNFYNEIIEQIKYLFMVQVSPKKDTCTSKKLHHENIK